GLDFVNPQGAFVALLKSDVNDGKKLAHNRISALSKSKTGEIWVGTDGGGLDLYNPISKKIKNYSKENTVNGLSNNFIVSLLEDSSQNIWVGTYRGGLNRLNLKTGKWDHYLQGQIEDGSDVRVIFEDLDGQIWAGTNRGGFYKYDKIKNHFNYIETLGKIDVRDIEQIKKGELWLATYGNGILHFNSQTQTYNDFSTANTNFLTNIIFNLKFLDSTHILAGTLNEGLMKFDLASNSIERFTVSDGLSNNTVSSILKDPAGVYWLGTYNGISTYDPVNNTIKNINNFENIKGNEFNNGAAIVNQDGTVYLGSNNGLNIFNAKILKSPEKHHFNTVFKDLEFYNKSVPIGGKFKNVLEKSIAYKDSLSVKYNQSLFSLDFAGLKYPSSENVEYSYLLEGYSDHWVNLTNFNKINFSKLPPGHYKLKLKTNANDYFESSKELFINIVPPFWMTIPAYILYLLLAVLLIWLSLRYYTNRFRLKQSLLFEKNQRQLENELNEERLRFYTGFSHELKTPLAMILAPVESLLSEIRKKEHVNSLRIIDKNARTLIIRINKLLNFRQTDEGLNKLNTGQYLFAQETLKWIEMYKPLAKKKGVLIIQDIIENNHIIYCDLEKIQIVFNNLMSNAIKYSRKGDSIKVSLKLENHGFLLQVKDTGAGIAANVLPHIFDWYYHANDNFKTDGSGIGLALSKRFIELHEGYINVESEINKKTIFTVFLPKGKQKGTQLTTIPLEHNVEQTALDILNENKNLESRANISAESEKELLLLIDDNPDIHEYLSSILAPNYDILHALNGEEGIQMGTKYVPDLIISDIMMPIKSGIDLCKELKNNKETSHIPIILLSAKDTKQSIIAGYNEGADAYITKPFSPAVLIARIKNLLKRKLEFQKDILNKETEGLQEVESHKKLNIEKKFLKQFEEVTLENLQTEGKPVEIIANSMGMSKASLYRKIKAISGKSINEYIRDIKLQKAVNLMENEGFNVSQASFEVGFKDQKYFRKIFKEKFGKLPSDFSSSKDFG
ncbi:MAG: ATP-binding protein, partial [Leeuwenhoekiella sp.]